MADLTQRELMMLEASVVSKVEELEANVSVLERDLCFCGGDLDTYLDISLEIDNVQDTIYEYKEILNKLFIMKNKGEK